MMAYYVLGGPDYPLISSGMLLPLACEVLARGVSFRFCARGGSMWPFIRDGDVLTMSPMRSVLPRRGDAVAFVNPVNGKFTVHRLIRIQSARYLMQGDSVAGMDGWIGPTDILGRVVAVERSARKVVFGLGVERIPIAWVSTLIHRHRLLWEVARIVGRALKKS